MHADEVYVYTYILAVRAYIYTPEANNRSAKQLRHRAIIIYIVALALYTGCVCVYVYRMRQPITDISRTRVMVN